MLLPPLRELDAFVFDLGGVLLDLDTSKTAAHFHDLAGVDFAARDLRMALVEATQGEIGTPTDQVLLLCFRYNPLTGKYGLAITRLIQVFGLLTCLVIFGGVGYMLHKERQVKSAATAPPVSS